MFSFGQMTGKPLEDQSQFTPSLGPAGQQFSLIRFPIFEIWTCEKGDGPMNWLVLVQDVSRFTFTHSAANSPTALASTHLTQPTHRGGWAKSGECVQGVDVGAVGELTALYVKGKRALSCTKTLKWQASWSCWPCQSLNLGAKKNLLFLSEITRTPQSRCQGVMCCCFASMAFLKMVQLVFFCQYEIIICFF